MFDQAERALRRRDKVLARIIKENGPCGLAPRRDYFVALCKAIVSQQLSTKAADTIYGRFRELFPRRRPVPGAVADLSDKQLRAVGLSGQKSRYMRDLADHFHNGHIPVRRFARMSDGEIIETLTQIMGVGVWTAQMFLIFVLNRLDVWPVDDLGIRRAVQVRFGYDDLPLADELHRVAEPWKPYRTVVAWHLWRTLDNDPMKNKNARAN